jgi:hypothetical protein
VTYNPSDGHLQMWIDNGMSSVLDTYVTIAPPRSIDGLYLGALSVNNTANNSIFVDDVAIGSGRLGCF